MNSFKFFGFIVLVGAVAAGYWTWNMLRPPLDDENGTAQAEQGFLTTRLQFNDKLEDIKQRREEIVVQIQRLDQRKQASADKLRELGVSTVGDLEINPQAQLEFSNMKRLIGDVEKFKQDVVVYDQAIGRIEVALADLDRQELVDNAGIGEQQSRVLNTMIRDIDDRLMEKSSPLEQLETQAILDDILSTDAD